MNIEEKGSDKQIIGIYVGLDLGQSQDYTAIVVMHGIRISDLDANADQNNLRYEYHVRHIDRLPLGTSYVDVIRYVSELLSKLNPGATLIMDSTGVGAPIVDMFKAAGLMPVSVQVHGGLNISCDKGVWHVPKRDLVSSVKRLLGEDVLKIAKDMPLVYVLTKELDNFVVKVNIATSHDTYEAWRENEHDDLVFALGLVSWWALEKRKDSFAIDAIEATSVMADTAEGAIHPNDYYFIGWIPARGEEEGALVVYNINHSAVVLIQRINPQKLMQDQIQDMFITAQRYETEVRALAGADEAIYETLEQRGGDVDRIDMNEEAMVQTYENLSLLIRYKQIKLPKDSRLLTEFGIGVNNPTVKAICLATYDIYPDIAAKTFTFKDPFDPDEWNRMGYYDPDTNRVYYR